MQLEFIPYHPALRDDWDAFVRHHPESWPGHDAAMIDLESHRGHPSFSHMVRDGAGEVVAVIPLFRTIAIQARLFRFSALTSGTTLRGGPLCCPAWTAKQQEDFWGQFSGWIEGLAARERIDRVQIGFPHHFGLRPVAEVFPYYPLRDYGFCEHFRPTLVLDLTAGDLMQQVTPVCRNMVRRAQKEELRVEAIPTRDCWMNGIDPLNRATFEGEAEAAWSRPAMETIWDGFIAAGRARAFAVYREGRVISAAAVTGTAHCQYYWLGFNDRDRPVPGANNLLLFHILEQLQAEGVRHFEMGSMENNTPRQLGITRFKRSFGAHPRYDMAGTLDRSPLKQATADGVAALIRRLKRRR